MIRFAVCVALALFAGGTLRAGEMDAEFGRKAPGAGSKPAATRAAADGSIETAEARIAGAGTELDREGPIQAWGRRGFGGFGYGGFGGFGRGFGFGYGGFGRGFGGGFGFGRGYGYSPFLGYGGYGFSSFGLGYGGYGGYGYGWPSYGGLAYGGYGGLGYGGYGYGGGYGCW